MIAIVGIAIGGLMAGACTVSIPSSAPTTTSTAPPVAVTAPVTSSNSTDDAFVASLVAEDSGFASVAPSLLVQGAHLICSNLGDGNTVQYVVSTLESSADGTSMTGNDIGFLIGSSVSTYCSQYVGDVTTWADENGAS
jgi:hypothetical protein